jgi:hypothetical protein
MSKLDIVETLTWKMKMASSGRTVWELDDEIGRRWGWCVNQTLREGDPPWMCHVGSWGQDEHEGFDPLVPIDTEIEQFGTASAGKSWVEEWVARKWMMLEEPVAS